MSDPDSEMPFERLAELDKLIHEPARLSILTALSSCGKANFTFLRRLTGLTRGNLSSHLSRLDEAGLVDVDKSFEDKTPVTTVSLSEATDGMPATWIRRNDRLRSVPPLFQFSDLSRSAPAPDPRRSHGTICDA
ncbi:MAG: ArsR family transcriptional regulator [Bacteroidetes bacterium QH_9_64_21]|nr:MAG: ArsR family transcriptional regulator [Bacteroidetes bacterium QH_9_64_21]